MPSNAATAAGTPMSGLQPATAAQHQAATNHLQKQPGAGPGRVREDEPPRAAGLADPAQRHIQPAHASESPAQGAAVRQQLQMYNDQAAKGNTPAGLKYGTVGPTGPVGPVGAVGAGAPAAPNPAGNTRSHGPVSKRDLRARGVARGYRRAVADVYRRSLEAQLSNIDAF